ncbi:hypothetical protein LE181_01760 [Streptomyces sp. SCA3-4]|uniref:hypothetical protein n=1 Tax=Streptomyces sichuanensis TaxID=2871810 RepID=UPI001CE2A9DA|nr:hypothetical protein [Streptomyces sichuanensis]MCA6090906.1 hypothetical protein [Streptomyces sichuanensis]
MDTQTPQEPVPGTADTPAGSTVSRKVLVRRWLTAVAAAGAVGWACCAVSDFFEELGGGPVRSAAHFRGQDINTREAGRKVLGQLRPGMWVSEIREGHGGTSCVDDFGRYQDGVTRKQLDYEWSLDYSSKADYSADLAKLRSAWEERGWKVHDTPPPETLNPDKPVPDWPGIRTTDDHGVTIAVRLDWFTYKPVLSADGGCIRYDSDDGVPARKRTGAATGKRPAPGGTITYKDGVQVTIGPVQRITSTPEMTEAGASAAHTYRIPITVTNRSGAPVKLGLGAGGYAGANRGVTWLPGYPKELFQSSPATVPEGGSLQMDEVFTARTLPESLRMSYQPSDLHAAYVWRLSTP